MQGKNISTKSPLGKVRIIGGKWRGRKLPVFHAEGLRPTGDRIKETLFNWLMGEIHGRKVLDCFAGSGALGLESISRGAEMVQFCEQNPQVITQLKQNLLSLKNSTPTQIFKGDTLQFLQTAPAIKFNIAFVDPPFALDLAPTTLELLSHHQWLEIGALVYVETAKNQIFSPHSNWECIKHKTAGEVAFSLYRFLG